MSTSVRSPRVDRGLTPPRDLSMAVLQFVVAIVAGLAALALDAVR